MEEKLTHKDLCIIGSKWLKDKCKCSISIHEPNGIKENPDAIGWRYTYGNSKKEGSILIEAKMSRSDFKNDFKKSFRINQHEGIGNWRFYICPTDLIKVDELPEKWGLLYVNEKRKVKIIKDVYNTNYIKERFNIVNTDNERFILTRWLARNENPEKMTMLLRETNNKYNRLVKQYNELRKNHKNENSLLLRLNLLSDDEFSDKTLDEIANSIDKLKTIEFLLNKYKETNNIDYIHNCLSKI